MLVCGPYEVVIHGTTSKGKIFRPSDWAECLCNILSFFTKDNRLPYSNWVCPILVGSVRCVTVDRKLEEDNPQMFRFLMDFTTDNDLHVIGCRALLKEQGSKQQGEVSIERVLLMQAIEGKHAAEHVKAADTRPEPQAAAPVVGVLCEILPGETATAFAVLSTLRPSSTDIRRFVEQINEHQRKTGYCLSGIFEEGKQNAVAVCGSHTTYNLANGYHICIDDTVTVSQSRRKGYVSRSLEEIRKVGAETGATRIHLNVHVNHDHTDAHRLCFKNGFEIHVYHFRCDPK